MTCPKRENSFLRDVFPFAFVTKIVMPTPDLNSLDVIHWCTSNEIPTVARLQAHCALSLRVARKNPGITSDHSSGGVQAQPNFPYVGVPTSYSLTAISVVFTHFIRI